MRRIWRNRAWSTCKGGLCLCHSGLNAALALLALVFAAVVVSIHLIGSVAIPGFFVDLLRERFAREGLDVSWEVARFDLTGRLHFWGLDCVENASGHPILHAEEVLFDLYLGGLVVGHIDLPEQLQGRGVEFFRPPELAPDAGAKAALEITEVRLRRRYPVLELNEIEARAEDLILRIHGELPLSLLRGGTDDPVEASTTLAELWRTRSRQVPEVLSQMAKVPPTNARLRVEIDANHQLRAHLHATFDSFRVGGAQFGPGVLAIPDINLSAKALERPLEGRVESITIPFGDEVVRLENARCWLRGAPNVGPAGWRHPGTLWWSSRGHAKDLPPIVLNGRAPFSLFPTQLQSEVRLDLPGARLDLNTTHRLADGFTHVDWSWVGSPAALLAAPRWSDLALDDEVRLSSRTRLTGVASFGAGGARPRGTFELVAFGSQVRDARFDEARVKGWFSEDRLQAGPIEAYDPGGQWATGYYLQDFESADYRIVAEGFVFPHRLDSLLPSFYRELWEDIDPGPHPVRGDVDVLSRWGTPDATTARVHAEGQDLAYLGLPVADLTLSLWQATGFIDLMRLETRSPRGELTGSVGITFPPAAAPETPQLRLLDLRSRVPLDDLAVVFGEEMSEAAELFEFSVAPDLTIDGLVRILPDETTEKQLDLTIHADAPWTLLEVPFDRLFSHLVLDGPVVRFDPFVARVGEHGRWELAGNLELENGKPHALDFETTMAAMPFDGVRDLLAQLSESEDPAPEDEASGDAETAEEESRGTVDLELTLGGMIGDWNSFLGAGALAIAEAPLGEIHLFGGLSRALSSIGIRLTSFRLEEATAPLEIHSGRLFFPDLVVRSPTLRINANGFIAFPENTVDARTKVFFLDTKGITPLTLLQPLLRPLGHALELEVSGPLDDPDWRLLHNPFRFLSRSNDDQRTSDGDASDAGPDSNASPPSDGPEPPAETPPAENVGEVPVVQPSSETSDPTPPKSPEIPVQE